MAKLKFRDGYQDLGAYPLLKDVVSRGDLVAEDAVSYKSLSVLISQTKTILTSGLLTIGTQYIIFEVSSGDDFSNVGFVSVNVPFIATGTTPINWSNGTNVLNYEISKPIVSVVQNNLGNVDFNLVYAEFIPGCGGSCTTIGIKVESNGLFTPGKTFVTCGVGLPDGINNTSSFVSAFADFIATGYSLPNAFVLYNISSYSANELTEFKDLPVEIKVYN